MEFLFLLTLGYLKIGAKRQEKWIREVPRLLGETEQQDLSCLHHNCSTFICLQLTDPRRECYLKENLRVICWWFRC